MISDTGKLYTFVTILSKSYDSLIFQIPLSFSTYPLISPHHILSLSLSLTHRHTHTHIHTCIPNTFFKGPTIEFSLEQKSKQTHLP